MLATIKGMKIKSHGVCRPYRKRTVMSFGSTLTFLPTNLAFLYLGLPAKSTHFPFSLSKRYTLLLVTDPRSSGVADSQGKQHAKAFQQEHAARWPQARPRSPELRRQTLASHGQNSNPSHTPRRTSRVLCSS